MISSILVFSLFFASSTALPSNPHPWIPAGPGDSRSPCPVLNALANHGYLPHDGKNITPALLNSTVQDVFGLEPALGNLVSGQVQAIVKPDGTIELHDLAVHNFIEHDASLSKDDANGAKYAPVEVDLKKVAELKTFSTDGLTLNINDWAHIRVSLEAKEAAPLSGDFAIIAAGEPSLIMNTFGGPVAGGDLSVSLDVVQSILGEEKLPSNFVKKEKVTLLSVGMARAKIISTMQAIRGAKPA